MAQRYEKLLALEKKLYCSEAPVIISAAQILRDGYSKKLLAQIKFLNISVNVISSLKVSISLFDAAGRLQQEAVTYCYTDLKAGRDAEFGQKSAVVLPDTNINSFRLSVDEVIYENGSSWQKGENDWSPLKAQKTLQDEFEDEEIATQYQIRYGSDCRFEPFDDMGLWFCTCGAVNNLSERSCHKCRRVYSALKEINIPSLKSECSVRLENEKEQQAADDAEKVEKRKKINTWAIALVPIVIVLVLVAVFVPRELKKSQDYEAAQSLVSSGDYDKAADAFEALGDYKDSSEQAEKSIPYEETLELMRYAETANPVGLKVLGIAQSSLKEDDDISVIMYEAAAKRFDELGDFRDSKELSNKCMDAIASIELKKLQDSYDAASKLLVDKEFSSAKDAFTALGDFKDSKHMAQEAIYQKALNLFGFMSQRNIRNVYASLSTDSDTPGKISFSKDFALGEGEGYITDFKAACGKDKVDFILEDQPSEGLVPFKDALTELFESLGSYKDSAEYIPQIEAICDYTKEFYELVASGDVYAAYDWLSAYEYEFENRDTWLHNLEIYKPYCGEWHLNSGDASLIPYIAGVSRNGTNVCTSFSSRVVIGEDSAVLKISNLGEEDYSIELRTDLGNADGFNNSDNPPFNYFLNISVFNRMAIMKYDSGGSIVSSCDYSPAY